MKRVQDELRSVESRMPGPGDIHFFLASLSPDLGLPLDVYAAGWSEWGAGVGNKAKRQDMTSIELVAKGAGEMVAAGRMHRLAPGDVFFLHSGRTYDYCTGPGGVLHKRFLMLFPGTSNDILQQLGLSEVDTLHVGPANLPRVERLFRRILSLLRGKAAGYRERASAAFYELLLALSNELPPHWPRTQLPRALGQAIRHAEEHIADAMTARDLARAAHCSTRHLNRLFTRHVGISTREWLIRSRMQHACHLLATTLTPVHVIGEAVGYADPYHFSATFRRMTGKAPRDYRRALTPRGRAKAASSSSTTDAQ